MKINNQTRSQIVKKGILSKDDIKAAPDWALEFADMILKISESEIFCSSFVSNFEVEKFLEEIQDIQDTMNLESCDKVTNNFEKKIKTVKIGIPNKIVPFLRNLSENWKLND